MDIEEVAHDTPEKILKVFVDPVAGLTDAQAAELAAGIGIPTGSRGAGDRRLQEALRLLHGDRRLAGRDQPADPRERQTAEAIKALDAKFNFDSNALFRHPEIVAYRDLDEEDPAEIEASKFDLAYIQLDGNIGCLVNGAGLAMATMDTIKLFGGEPANFLDVGGGATAEKVTEAFKIMLANPKVKAILVNIFGGIMRCDTIAEGVIAACKADQPERAAGGAHEGHERRPRQEDAGRLGPADHQRRLDGRSRAEGHGRAEGSLKEHHEHPDQQEHQGHHAGHHRQDRPVPHPHVPRLRERQDLLRRRRQPEEGRRGLRRHPDLRHRQGSGQARPARPSA